MPAPEPARTKACEETQGGRRADAAAQGTVKLGARGTKRLQMTLRKNGVRENAGLVGGKLSQRLLLKVEWLRTGKKKPKVVYLGVLSSMRIVKLGTFKPKERRTYRSRPTSPTADPPLERRETTPTWAPISRSSSTGGAGRSSSARAPAPCGSRTYRAFSHFCRYATSLSVLPASISPRSRFSFSSTSMARLASSTACALGSTMTPSSSPTIQSPGCTV